jgi:hypothetical protein
MLLFNGFLDVGVGKSLLTVSSISHQQVRSRLALEVGVNADFGRGESMLMFDLILASHSYRARPKGPAASLCVAIISLTSSRVQCAS